MNCECCDRPLHGSGYASPDGRAFCSIECACYGGRFSVREGWINEGQPPRKCPPKQKPD